MADYQSNPLLSTHKSSDPSLRIHLHPLVLLTISDYITRHSLRRQQGPIVGALLGQQNGREISLEYAFDCRVIQGSGDSVILDDEWFKDRLQQYKDVHKAPVLELVGWFTTAPPTGPQPQHVPIHEQILKDYNEAAILLAFHPSAVVKGDSVGGKLPLTIYESAFESGKAEGQSHGNGAMEVEGQDVAPAQPLDLRFRELPYSVETGEAEMISVDFVATGAGAAAAANNTRNGKAQASQTTPGEVETKKSAKQKEKGKEKEKEAKMEESLTLSAEDERLIASLTARANAIKMLHVRIQMLKEYLITLPPSYLTTSSTSTLPGNIQIFDFSELSYPILRSIQALVSRLPLLLPADHATFEQERLAEKSDVSLVDLLGNISKSVKDTREMGRKFGIVEQIRQSTKKGGSSSFTEDFFTGFSDKGEGVARNPQSLLSDGYLP